MLKVLLPHGAGRNYLQVDSLRMAIPTEIGTTLLVKVCEEALVIENVNLIIMIASTMEGVLNNILYFG